MINEKIISKAIGAGSTLHVMAESNYPDKSDIYHFRGMIPLSATTAPTSTTVASLRRTNGASQP